MKVRRVGASAGTVSHMKLQVPCPLGAVMFNQFMAFVDIQNKGAQSTFAIQSKVSKFWKKIFCILICQVVYAVYSLYMYMREKLGHTNKITVLKNLGKPPQKKIRIRLVEEMCEEQRRCYAQTTCDKRRRGHVHGVPVPPVDFEHLVQHHTVPIKDIPSALDTSAQDTHPDRRTSGNTGRSTAARVRGECHACGKRTTYDCFGCELPLCMGHCFVKHHAGSWGVPGATNEYKEKVTYSRRRRRQQTEKEQACAHNSEAGPSMTLG